MWRKVLSVSLSFHVGKILRKDFRIVGLYVIIRVFFRFVSFFRNLDYTLTPRRKQISSNRGNIFVPLIPDSTYRLFL